MDERTAFVSACDLAIPHQPACLPSKLQNKGTGEAEEIQAPSKPLTTW